MTSYSGMMGGGTSGNSPLHGGSGGGGGLGPPLVTIPAAAVHGSGIRTATSLATTPVTHHPLAPAATSLGPISALGATTVEIPYRSTQVSVSSASGSQPSPTIVTIPSTPSVTSQTSSNTFSSPAPSGAGAAKTTPGTLDGLADAFLSGPSYRTTHLNLPPLLRPPPLPRNEEGLQRLRTLVERRAWGDVLQVAQDMIRGPTSPYTPIYAALVSDDDDSNAQILKVGGPLEHLQAEIVEILTLECTAWLKLRRYADLGREVERWTFLQQNRKDSDGKETPDVHKTTAAWVPWNLHILAASSLQYTSSNPKRSSDVLMAIRFEQLASDDSKWLLATDNALSNVFLRQKEYRLALASLDSMMDLLPAVVESQVAEHWHGANDPAAVAAVLLGASQCEVLSRQGRALLQIGALPEASRVFENAKVEWKTTAHAVVSAPQDVQELAIVQLAPAQLLVNDGLLAFAYGNNDAALDDFRKTLEYLRASNLSLTKYCREHWVGPAMVVGTHSFETLMSECTNNMAICALHACRLHDAVRLLENLVREDPTAFLTERMAFNLCTLYELGADSTVSARKKRVLQLVAKRFFLHDVGPESFRVN